jgi:hypothetical protein
MIGGSAASALTAAVADALGQTKGSPASCSTSTAGDRQAQTSRFVGAYDMRDDLSPQRLTMACWGADYALRHGPGGSFANFDRALDEAVDRAYNTLRIDPFPQWVDLAKPERILEWPDPKQPYMPWNWNTAVKGPVGNWIIEFVEKLLKRPSLNYTLSAWWFMPGMVGVPPVPAPLRKPATTLEGAEMWAVMLRNWKKRFGFDRLLYVDIANETPFFFPDIRERMKKETGLEFDEDGPPFTPEQIAFFTHEFNKPLALLRREFPELRFTTSIHADLRWLEVPLELDCLDVHFYTDTDPRWNDRTRFKDFSNDHMFETDRWFAEFSDRSKRTAAAMAPMLRARQRYKMEQFAAWAARRGAALTTTEGWSSWYYIDHPKLDWSWLLDWSKWACDDAIDCGFWGWTPHNCPTPQFANWKDVNWHRTLNERFLNAR